MGTGEAGTWLELDTKPARLASACAKDDFVSVELEAIFAENQGFFEKEASVYAKDVG